MGQIEDFRLFACVVDEGSIAKAADELGIAKSAVSRRLGQLEARLATRLIDRQPGTWVVTEAGQELYQRAVPVLADVEDIEADFNQNATSLRGPLRVTIALEFGMTFLRPVLFDFLRNHPEIELTVDLDDRVIDLERENYDLAIRVSSESSEISSQMRLGVTRHGLYASPLYVRTQGTPKNPSDLKTCAILQYGSHRRSAWSFRFHGKTHRIEFKPVLSSRTGAFLLDAAKNGLGIARLPEFVVAESLQNGGLVEVLPEAEFDDFVVHVAHSSSRRLNNRMRAFIRAIQAKCADLQK